MTNHTAPRLTPTDRANAILLPYELTDAQHAYAVEALVALVKAKKIAWSKIDPNKHLRDIIADALTEAETSDMDIIEELREDGVSADDVPDDQLLDDAEFFIEEDEDTAAIVHMLDTPVEEDDDDFELDTDVHPVVATKIKDQELKDELSSKRKARAKKVQDDHTRKDGTGPHAACDHESTKVARAKCRRERARAQKDAK